MDEIIGSGSLPQEEAPAMTLAQRVADFQERLPSLLFQWDEYKRHHKLKAKHFLAAALALGAVSTAVTLYTPGYAVSVNGQELGVVADTAQFERIVDRVERRAGEILDCDYTLDADIDYRWRIVEKKNISSLSGFETFLFNQVDEITHSYVLTVDGQTIGVQADGTAVSQLLDSLKAVYRNENTILCDFTVPVELRYEYVGAGQETDLADITALLTSNTVEAVTYTVQAGNTYSGIARKHGMSVDQLLEMNPEATLESLMPGDVLTVSQNVPYLSVRTVDQLTYEEAIPAPVEYVEDDSMYQGDTKTLDPGAEGSALVSARVTYLNGMEQERDVTSYQQLTAPKTKTVAKGTKARPKTMPTGHFIWPVRGRITSNYGSRTLFGTYNFHGGLDIACPYGTPVKAADGGTVTFAGWQGSYGKLVIIRHDNGKETYYAHNSSLTVSAGQKVYQGQQIARVGMTGTATGYHCHFEVRINGQRQNPRSYLP